MTSVIRSIPWNDLWETDFYKEVYSESDPAWRHGEYRTEVYKDTRDGTFWRACYSISGDGDYNEWRDDEPEGWDCIRVEPYQKTVTDYKIYETGE